MRLFVLGVLTLFSIQLSAKEINPEIKMAAKNFYLNQVEALNNPILNLSASVKRHCEPVEKTSCIKELCKHKNCGVYGEDIAEICVGSNGDCVAALCKQKNCNVYWDDVAQVCVESNGLCVEELCKHKNCNVYWDDVANACKGGVDEECVIELCKSKNCNVYWDDVAQACGGN